MQPGPRILLLAAALAAAGCVDPRDSDDTPAWSHVATVPGYVWHVAAAPDAIYWASYDDAADVTTLWQADWNGSARTALRAVDTVHALQWGDGALWAVADESIEPLVFGTPDRRPPDVGEGYEFWGWADSLAVRMRPEDPEAYGIGACTFEYAQANGTWAPVLSGAGSFVPCTAGKARQVEDGSPRMLLLFPGEGDGTFDVHAAQVDGGSSTILAQGVMAPDAMEAVGEHLALASPAGTWVGHWPSDHGHWHHPQADATRWLGFTGDAFVAVSQVHAPEGAPWTASYQEVWRIELATLGYTGWPIEGGALGPAASMHDGMVLFALKPDADDTRSEIHRLDTRTALGSSRPMG